MLRIRWQPEEAAVLLDFYLKHGSSLRISEDDLLHLSQIYKKRAKILGLKTDEKFRNLPGMKLQLACIHYVATNGKEGMSGASKLFYEIYDLFKNNPSHFYEIVNSFYFKYT